MENVHTLDYAVFLIYLVLMAGVGLFFGWFVKDMSGYFKGGGVIPWPVAGISNYMSMFSTFVFVAYAGIAYDDGLVALLVIWCTVPPCIIAAKVFAHRWRRAELTTPVEYLETRFGRGARQFFSWTGLLMRVLDNIVRMYAIGLFLATVVPWELNTVVLVSGLIITFYTVIGGLWAVTVLDTIQFVVLLLSSVILFPLSLHAVGGFAGIAEVAPEHMSLFHGPKAMPVWLLAYYVMILFKYNANWAFIQRLYCVRDERAARRVAWLSATLFFATPILFVVPPLAARVLLPDLPDHEMAYVAISAKLLPSGLLGMMLAAMFSATMSSLNSEYNVMAGVLTNDIYKRLFAPGASPHHLLWAGRVFTILIGLGITLGAMLVGGMGGAFEANKLFTSILAIPLAVPLLFGLLSRRPTSRSLILTVLGGAGLAMVLNFWSTIQSWFGEGSWVAGLAAPSWEVATLTTIAASVLIFCVSGWVFHTSASRQELVNRFLDKLKTPLDPANIPSVDPQVRVHLIMLMSVIFIAVGLMYVGASAAHMTLYSGIVGMIAGGLCTLVGGAVGYRAHLINRKLNGRLS
ncbi:Na+:solute symporter [Planctomycetales bacterium ZRK34]|nr:Na+:solute symporter [Planctomycetales bacterium ZRK34]